MELIWRLCECVADDVTMTNEIVFVVFEFIFFVL